mgnify:CR=1 FL=1
MATKNDLEVKVTGLEETMVSTVRRLSNEISVLNNLLAKTREDLDKVRPDVERLKNVVTTLQALTANYTTETSKW